VVVLNWNGGEDTLDCLASVDASDLSGVRVYVPDNGSTDGSRQRIVERFPQARLIENGTNLGFSGGNNRGWRVAVADGASRILFLNNDAVLAPDALRRLSHALDAYPDVGAVSPRIFRGHSPQDGSERVWYEKGCVRLHDYFVAYHGRATEAELNAPCYEVDCVCGCALLVRAEALEASGGFDEGFFAYYEDVDLSLTLRHLGWRCAVVPAARAWHKVSASTGGDYSATSAFFSARNNRYLVERHADAVTKRRFRSRYLRSWLYHAARYARHNPRGIPAVLQGGLCGLVGQKGARPRLLPAAPRATEKGWGCSTH
jgi:hypothetical protein